MARLGRQRVRILRSERMTSFTWRAGGEGVPCIRKYPGEWRGESRLQCVQERMAEQSGQQKPSWAGP